MGRIVTIIGTRPQIIKMAPVGKALDALDDHEHVFEKDAALVTTSVPISSPKRTQLGSRPRYDSGSIRKRTGRIASATVERVRAWRESSSISLGESPCAS